MGKTIKKRIRIPTVCIKCKRKRDLRCGMCYQCATRGKRG